MIGWIIGAVVTVALGLGMWKGVPPPDEIKAWFKKK